MHLDGSPCRHALDDRLAPSRAGAIVGPEEGQAIVEFLWKHTTKWFKPRTTTPGS